MLNKLLFALAASAATSSALACGPISIDPFLEPLFEPLAECQCQRDGYCQPPPPPPPRPKPRA